MRDSSKLAKYSATDSSTTREIVDLKTSHTEIVTSRPNGTGTAAASSTRIVGSRRSRMLNAAIDQAAHEISLAHVRLRTNCDAR
jgi:hypothetical protein